MIVEIDRVSKISHYRIASVSVDLLPKERLNACPVCGGRDISTLYGMDFSGHTEFSGLAELNKMICENCGHLFFDRFPRHSQLKAFYASSWHSAININPKLIKLTPNYANWAPIHFLKALQLDKTLRTLDFGCGYGHAPALRDLIFQDENGEDL